jgi:hypothetical protein
MRSRWDGTPRTYRDDKTLAVKSAEQLKIRNPNVDVTIRDLQTGETIVVKNRPA